MKITQEQFDAILFYTLQSYRHAAKHDNAASWASYEIARDRFVAVHYGINIVRADSQLACDVLCRQQIGCNPPHSEKFRRLDNAWLRFSTCLQPGTENTFKKRLTAKLNQHFETNLAYTLDGSITPGFLMHFLDVYAKEALIGASLILLAVLLVLLAPPILATVAGVGFGAGAVLTAHSLLESSFLYFSPALKPAVYPETADNALNNAIKC